MLSYSIAYLYNPRCIPVLSVVITRLHTGIIRGYNGFGMKKQYSRLVLDRLQVNCKLGQATGNMD